MNGTQKNFLTEKLYEINTGKHKTYCQLFTVQYYIINNIKAPGFKRKPKRKMT